MRNSLVMFAVILCIVLISSFYTYFNSAPLAHTLSLLLSTVENTWAVIIVLSELFCAGVSLSDKIVTSDVAGRQRCPSVLKKSARFSPSMHKMCNSVVSVVYSTENSLLWYLSLRRLLCVQVQMASW